MIAFLLTVFIASTSFFHLASRPDNIIVPEDTVVFSPTEDINFIIDMVKTNSDATMRRRIIYQELSKALCLDLITHKVRRYGNYAPSITTDVRKIYIDEFIRRAERNGLSASIAASIVIGVFGGGVIGVAVAKAFGQQNDASIYIALVLMTVVGFAVYPAIAQLGPFTAQDLAILRDVKSNFSRLLRALKRNNLLPHELSEAYSAFYDAEPKEYLQEMYDLVQS